MRQFITHSHLDHSPRGARRGVAPRRRRSLDEQLRRPRRLGRRLRPQRQRHARARRLLGGRAEAPPLDPVAGRRRGRLACRRRRRRALSCWLLTSAVRRKLLEMGRDLPLRGG